MSELINLLKESWKLYKENIGKIIVFNLIIWLLSVILSLLVTLPMLPYYNIIKVYPAALEGSLLVYLGVAFIIFLIFEQGIFFASQRFYNKISQNQEINIIEIIKESYRKSLNQIVFLILILGPILLTYILAYFIHPILFLPLIFEIVLANYFILKFVDSGSIIETLSEINDWKGWENVIKLTIISITYGLILGIPALIIILSIILVPILAIYSQFVLIPLFEITIWRYYHKHLK